LGDGQSTTHKSLSAKFTGKSKSAEIASARNRKAIWSDGKQNSKKKPSVRGV
jgi:hypothetical protein